MTTRQSNPADLADPFGPNCRKIREVLGLSIADLSKTSGLTGAAISQIENGLRDPQLKSVRAIAKGLGAKLSKLLDDTL